MGISASEETRYCAGIPPDPDQDRKGAMRKFFEDFLLLIGEGERTGVGIPAKMINLSPRVKEALEQNDALLLCETALADEMVEALGECDIQRLVEAGVQADIFPYVY